MTKKLQKNSIRVRVGTYEAEVFSPIDLDVIHKAQANFSCELGTTLWIEVTNATKKKSRHVVLHDALEIASPPYELGPKGRAYFNIGSLRHDQSYVLLAYPCERRPEGKEVDMEFKDTREVICVGDAGRALNAMQRNQHKPVTLFAVFGLLVKPDQGI